MIVKAEIQPNLSIDMLDVKHIKKHARTKSMAAVMMGNVTLGKKAIGNLTGEYADGITWEGIELPETIKSRFRPARYEDGFYDSEIYNSIKNDTVKGETPDYSEAKVTRAQALVGIGTNFYYLP